MAKRLAGALQQGFRATPRSAHNLGDFFDGQVLEGLQEESVALIGRQSLDGAADGDGAFEVRAVGHGRIELLMPTALSIGICELATGDPIEPATGVCLSRRFLRKRGGEGLGGDVFGVLGVIQAARYETEDRVEVFLEEICPGFDRDAFEGWGEGC